MTGARQAFVALAAIRRAVVVAVATLGLASAFAPLSVRAQPVRAQPLRATRVTTYVPVIPHGAAVSGHCWTRSLAAPNRGDAYRCMAGDSIYDPCFVPRRPGGVVVCDVNPATRGPGFAMRLTRPLPPEAPFAGTEVRPWLVALADGEICVPQTGTHEALDGATIGYECSEARGLRNDAAATGLVDGSITPGTVWHARKAVYKISRGGRVTGAITVVPLAAVWR